MARHTETRRTGVDVGIRDPIKSGSHVSVQELTITSFPRADVALSLESDALTVRSMGDPEAAQEVPSIARSAGRKHEVGELKSAPRRGNATGARHRAFRW